MSLYAQSRQNSQSAISQAAASAAEKDGENASVSSHDLTDSEEDREDSDAVVPQRKPRERRRGVFKPKLPLRLFNNRFTLAKAVQKVPGPDSFFAQHLTQKNDEARLKERVPGAALWHWQPKDVEHRKLPVRNEEGRYDSDQSEHMLHNGSSLEVDVNNSQMLPKVAGAQLVRFKGKVKKSNSSSKVK